MPQRLPKVGDEVPQDMPAVGADVPSLPPIGAEVPDMGASAMNFAVVNGQRVPVDDGPMDLVRGAFSTLNPIPGIQAAGKALIPQAVARALGEPDSESYGPVHALHGLLAAQTAVKSKGDAAWQQGDYATAARHYIDWLLPVIGPAIDKAADEMQQGRPWRGAGEAIGLALGMSAPSAIKHARVRVPALVKNPNPAEAAAVVFGQARGVPVDAGTATGNMFVRGVQAGADNTPVGAVIAGRGRQRTGIAMERLGGELADDVRGVASTPETAGAGVMAQLESRIQAHAQFADHAYDALRTAARDPKNARTVVVKRVQEPTGILDVQGQPITRTRAITETIELPVDLRAAKARLKPVYDQLTRQYSVTQQQASSGYKALMNIVHGPDYAPLVQVEADLGAIKSIARGADMPELRTQSQGLAAEGVTRLSQAVDTAARAGGPKVWRALQDGRAATSAKYGTADVLERMRSEPVQAFRQMVAAKDSGIDLLRTVAKESPTAVPQIARAYLDDLLHLATAEGGFDRGARLWAEWQKLGPETKNVLFPQAGQVRALDHYFLLAKKLAESPNPSRTALTAASIGSGGLIFTNPLTGIPITLGAGALSAMLRHPKAVTLLTRGLTISLGGARASNTLKAAAAADIVSAARAAGVDLSVAPAAEDQSTAPQRPSQSPAPGR